MSGIQFKTNTYSHFFIDLMLKKKYLKEIFSTIIVCETKLITSGIKWQRSCHFSIRHGLCGTVYKESSSKKSLSCCIMDYIMLMSILPECSLMSPCDSSDLQVVMQDAFVDGWRKQC